MTLSRPVAPVRGMRRRHTPHRKAHHGPPLYPSLSPCPDTPLPTAPNVCTRYQSAAHAGSVT